MRRWGFEYALFLEGTTMPYHAMLALCFLTGLRTSVGNDAEARRNVVTRPEVFERIHADYLKKVAGLISPLRIFYINQAGR